MNEQTLGIIFGIGVALVIILISISLTLFYIYYSQPSFICELCKSNCSIMSPYIINIK